MKGLSIDTAASDGSDEFFSWIFNSISPLGRGKVDSCRTDATLERSCLTGAK